MSWQRETIREGDRRGDRETSSRGSAEIVGVSSNGDVRSIEILRC
jgi:hypothetical protein